MSQTTHQDRATRDRVLELMERELEGGLDEASRRWLAEHRGAFPEIDDALAAVDGDGALWAELSALDHLAEAEPPSPGEAREQIRAHLAGEPVEALPLEPKPRFGIVLLTLVAVGLTVVGLGVRADAQDQPWYQLVLPAVLLVGGYLVAMMSFDHLDRRGHRALSLAIVLLAPALFVGVALTMRAGPHSHVATKFLGPALGCGTLGLLVGLVVLVPAVVLARRGMAGPSQLGAFLLGVTAASVGVAALHLRCPLVDLSHVLAGHGLLFVLVPLAALLLRRVRRLA